MNGVLPEWTGLLSYRKTDSQTTGSHSRGVGPPSRVYKFANDGVSSVNFGFCLANVLFAIQCSTQGDTKVDWVVGMLKVFIDPGDFQLSYCFSVVQVENTSLCYGWICSWMVGSVAVRHVDQCFFKLVFQFLKCVGLGCDGKVVHIDETSGVGCDRLVICVDVEKY